MSLCLFYMQFPSMFSHSLLMLYQLAQPWLAVMVLDGRAAEVCYLFTLMELERSCWQWVLWHWLLCQLWICAGLISVCRKCPIPVCVSMFRGWNVVFAVLFFRRGSGQLTNTNGQWSRVLFWLLPTKRKDLLLSRLLSMYARIKHHTLMWWPWCLWMLRRVRCLSSLMSDYASYQSLLGNFKNILAPVYINPLQLDYRRGTDTWTY